MMTLTRPQHLTGVYFTRRAADLFRKRYWVECAYCAVRRGPFKTPEYAAMVRRALDTIPECVRGDYA